MDRIPVYFEIRAQAHAVRRFRTENICEIEENRLLAAGRKTEIVLCGDPTAVAIRHLNAQPVGAPAAALRDGDVHGGFRVVDGALRNQVERATFRRVIAEIDFQIVISGYALVLAATKAAHRLAIEIADEVSHVLAGVIRGAGDIAWS